MVVFRLHLLLFHHPDHHWFRRHGRAPKGQRAEQQAGIRDVRPDIHFIRLGHSRRLPQFISAEICHNEYGGRKARRGRGSTGKGNIASAFTSSIKVLIIEKIFYRRGISFLSRVYVVLNNRFALARRTRGVKKQYEKLESKFSK